MELQSDMDIRKPAVFLDRDGVLTKEKSYICTIREMEIFPYASESIQQIKNKGYYTIIVTNQSGIARGLFTEDDLQKMHLYLQQKTGIDAVYYCPHHPEGKIRKYRKICHCRKPETGMIEQACSDYSIDMDKSFMVGDRAGDIITGQRMGLKTILLESGYGLERLEADVKPDYILKDLRAVADMLI